MPSNVWYESSPYVRSWVADKAVRRAMTTVRRIMDKPYDVSFERNGQFISEQTVRIEGRIGVETQAHRTFANANTFERGVIVFGVRNHPTIPTLDIQVGDRFGYLDANYVVIGVTYHSGEIQAHADREQT